MGIVAQLIANGLIAGSIYALVAAGFSLIFSTVKFIHLAHGATIISSSYVLFTLFNLFGLNFYFSCLFTIAFASFLGFGMNRLVYKPLRQRKSSNLIILIASIALLILIESIILAVYGANIRTLSFIEIQEGLNILGATATPLQIIIFFVSIILLLLFWIFMKYTKLGKEMRAVADNTTVAGVVGINIEKVYDYCFIIGSAVAGIAAILISLEQNIEATLGTSLMIKGFTGAVIGGINSVPGSILGSYLLGLIENFGIWYLPSGYKDAIAFLLLFLFLLFKPEGILGIRKGVKQ
ncbi:MAG: branched-chain amino acid ABC transporter permease [Candidatus Woesearchaeota archaeon]